VKSIAARAFGVRKRRPPDAADAFSPRRLADPSVNKSTPRRPGVGHPPAISDRYTFHSE
jgi:hypothetical protein